eukprot:483979-Alexandrium_andersonii.AAC.1
MLVDAVPFLDAGPPAGVTLQTKLDARKKQPVPGQKCTPIVGQICAECNKPLTGLVIGFRCRLRPRHAYAHRAKNAQCVHGMLPPRPTAKPTPMLRMHRRIDGSSKGGLEGIKHAMNINRVENASGAHRP